MRISSTLSAMFLFFVPSTLLAEAGVVEKYADWEVRCVSESNCYMYQLLHMPDGTPVVEFNGVPLAGEKAVLAMTIVSPKQTLLSKGMEIDVDGAGGRKYPFAFCDDAGCYVRAGISKKMLSRYKRGSKANLTIYPATAPDFEINLALSLSGFTAAYDDVFDRLGLEIAETKRQDRTISAPNELAPWQKALKAWMGVNQNVRNSGGTRTYQCKVHCEDIREKITFPVNANSYADAESRANYLIDNMCKPYGGRAFFEYLECL